MHFDYDVLKSRVLRIMLDYLQVPQWRTPSACGGIVAAEHWAGSLLGYIPKLELRL